MKRMSRSMTCALLALCILMGGASATAFAQKVTKMKLVGTTVANPALGEYAAMLKFAELVKQHSNGSMLCEVYPANQLGTTAELAEGVSLGTIEAGIFGFDIIGNLDPAMNVMAMPYMFRDLAHQRLVLETDNPAGNMVKASLKKNANMKIIGVLYRPMRVLGNTRNAVRSPADMKGMTIRSPEAAANVKTIEAMGAMPVTISWAEVFTSLSLGVCHGVENAITELYSIKLYETLKFVSETNHLPAPIPLVISDAWFQKLPKDQQDALIKAGEETTAFRFAGLQAEIENAWKVFEQKGVKILRADQIDMDAFRASCANVYKYFSQTKHYFTEDLYQAIKNTK
ncbi:MAG TPA: TRAP transporter substrate-binding protein [Rectinemataceae bacterium]|nr:TRAP transporter substrate-binding protein [Rectinemataceae bacterium]